MGLNEGVIGGFVAFAQHGGTPEVEPAHFGGCTMVKAEANASVPLEALKRGDFYASQGPDLKNVEIRSGEVFVESSAATSVIVQGREQAGCMARR